METANNLTTGNNIVDRMMQVDLTLSGAYSCIPNTWYKTIRFDNGKPNLIACIILSEIVYWYKPTVVCDERSGHISQIKKKFKYDLLQKSYGDLAERYGISKQQATNAILYLEKIGVIKRVFRTLTTYGGKLPNVLFIELNVERLIEITYPSDTRIKDDTNVDDRGVCTESDTYGYGEIDISTSIMTSGTLEEQTNTNITPNISANITPSSRGTDEEEVRENVAANINLIELKNENPEKIDRIDMLYDVICDVVGSRAKTIRINKGEISQVIVKNEYLKIGKKEILYVLDTLDKPKEEPVGNLYSYMKTLLYNSVRMAKEYFNQKGKVDLSKKSEAKSKNSFINFEQRQYSDEEWNAVIERKLIRPQCRLG